MTGTKRFAIGLTEIRRLVRAERRTNTYSSQSFRQNGVTLSRFGRVLPLQSKSFSGREWANFFVKQSGTAENKSSSLLRECFPCVKELFL